jgi:hypothetical protein
MESISRPERIFLGLYGPPADKTWADMIGHDGAGVDVGPRL